MHPSCQHAKQHCATDSQVNRTATSVALLFSFRFTRRCLLLFYTKHKILWWLSLQVVPLCVLTRHPKLLPTSHITWWIWVIRLVMHIDDIPLVTACSCSCTVLWCLLGDDDVRRWGGAFGMDSFRHRGLCVWLFLGEPPPDVTSFKHIYLSQNKKGPPKQQLPPKTTTTNKQQAAMSFPAIDHVIHELHFTTCNITITRLQLPQITH